jgi:hypothetical protein
MQWIPAQGRDDMKKQGQDDKANDAARTPPNFSGSYQQGLLQA